MSEESHTVTSAAREQELVIERVLNAPRELVFKAWTDPEMLRKWWGPEQYTSPACRVDLRVGGGYHFCMRSPEGQEIWNTGIYREIVHPERLVMADFFADADGNRVHATHYGFGEELPFELQVTVTFEQMEDGRTKLTLRHAGIPTGELKEQTDAGWNSSLDKLAAALATG